MILKKCTVSGGLCQKLKNDTGLGRSTLAQKMGFRLFRFNGTFMPKFPEQSGMPKKGEPTRSPHGRGGSFRSVLRFLLEKKGDNDGKTTQREKVSQRLIELALDGKHPKFMEILMDRTDGKVKDVVESYHQLKLYGKDAPTDDV